jgi:REP element-mobilizing transposase RayT
MCLHVFEFRYVVDVRKASQLSFHDYRLRSGRGGPRQGSGRKPSGRHCDPKRKREPFADWKPVHVTLRVREGLPNLRQRVLLAQLRETFRQACSRPDFRLVHYSVQRNHFHLIVEAKDQQALGRGMKSIGARIARAIQRIFELSGRILSGAYHAHVLGCPSEVRRALAYVLLNARKHTVQAKGTPPPVGLDAASSSRWFDGFTRRPISEGTGPMEVAPPRLWVLRWGWRRAGGPIDPETVPGG